MFKIESDVSTGNIRQVALTQSEIDDLASFSVDLQAIPQSITALQGLLVIGQSGLDAAYDSWANSADRTFSERAFIAKAQVWNRDDPTLQAAAMSLGLSAANVDSLFQLAATL